MAGIFIGAFVVGMLSYFVMRFTQALQEVQVQQGWGY
jgi:hypothetical protein